MSARLLGLALSKLPLGSTVNILDPMIEPFYIATTDNPRQRERKPGRSQAASIKRQARKNKNRRK